MRVNDRVVITTNDGRTHFGVLTKMTAKYIYLSYRKMFPLASINQITVTERCYEEEGTTDGGLGITTTRP